MTSNSLTYNEERDILKTILDCMAQLFFLYPNMNDSWYICTLFWSQIVVVNWQNWLFIPSH